MASYDVRYVVEFDDKGAYKNIQTFDEAIKDLQKTSNTARTSAKSFGDEFVGKLIPAFTLASLAADGAKKAFRAVNQELVDCVKSAIESERVDRALESSIAIVGQSAGGTAARIRGYAAAIAQKTIYDDEAIKSAQALIIQMRGTTREIEQATKGAIGLASVYQMDLQSAARAVAQGMEGNYIQLSRLIPSIRNASNEADKHAAFLKAMADGYIRAQEDAKTFGGRLDNLKKSYSELKETAGEFVTKNAGVIKTLNDFRVIVDWINSLTQKMPKNIPILSLPADLAKYQNFIGILAKIVGFEKDIREHADSLKESLSEFENPAFESSFINISKGVYELRHQAVLGKPNIEEIVKLIDSAILPSKEWALALGKIRWELGNTELPPSHSLPRAQREWLGLEDAVEKVAHSIYDDYRQALGMADAAANQFQQNATIRVENEYKQRLALINANVKDEKERQDAIMALEAEYEIKRTSAQRKAAKAAKAIALMEAIVNTADAYTKALAQGGFIFGIPMASVIAALGAVQIAAIAAQPIPLAKGGYFKEPTLLPTGERTYLAGEAGAEVLSPVPMMRRIVREESGGVHVEFGSGAIVINARELDDATIRNAGRRIFREIENRASLRGRRIQ